MLAVMLRRARAAAQALRLGRLPVDSIHKRDEAAVGREATQAEAASTVAALGLHQGSLETLCTAAASYTGRR